ncbi:DEAD/DEAH box helicase [Nocardioides bizhenqiangii]|uniref:DEAD/DEAH box helicase n=1 Tax=Nocardioides bizhenqiangii TaxID=3095076 RepID=A0ABZ0ZLG2_9ACTN|nr:DEAD/DEAH box helicase [Nocardioides sp. HM61]WQQ25183.1 DEAD/DEAH box helicase [Nocardioides sp. HM61]
MDVLASLTDDFLEEHFAPETLERARGYLDRIDGPPHLQQLSAGSVTATAYVYGSAPTAYHVQLHCEVGRPSGRSRARTHGWIFSLCTCPVRNMCKHGAAVALSMREGHVSADRAPEWERRLGSLVEDLSRTADPEVEPFPLALQFTLEHRRVYSYRDEGPLLCLRPLRPGAKQAWIKGGADWSDIPGAVLARTLLPDQADAVGALHGALQRHRGYHVAGTAPTLAQFGPHLPRMLRAAEAAGVELVPVPPLAAVTIREKPVGMTAEITSDDTVARMTLGVDVDGELWRGEQVRFLGNDRVVALLHEGHLQIAELDRDAPTVARRLIEEEPLEVPATELDAFRGRLAGLLRHLTVRSPDGSVDVPAPVRPILVLKVTWRSSAAADLDWGWRYDDQRCDLNSRDRLGGLRDRRAEATVRDSVPASLLGRDEVRDGDALELAIHDLPHLRDLPDVEVTEVQRPDFREATSAPEISFDVVEPDDDAGYTDWLDLEVTVNVEGERVPLPDVIAALTLEHEFLVLPSGLFITTDRPEFDRLREVVTAAAELRERDGDRIGVGTHDLGLWAQLAETGIVDAEAAAWVARAQALRDLVEIPRPDVVGLTTELRSYQREGFWWLAFLWEHGLGGILADDMGLGKTLQVLALVQHARRRRPDVGPFLVVAPTSVVTAWAHEAEHHAPELRVGLCGRRTDDVAAIAADSDVVVTTYTVLRLAHARYAAVPWGGLVLDEAQQVKNHQSKTYAAVRTIAAPFKLAVTGTPFENRLMELWALLSITVPGLYPWPRQFNERVVRPVERAGDRVVLDRFRSRIRPFLLRRTKELVASDLPPKQEQVLDVVLEPRHRKIYDTHLARERQRILGLVDDFDRNRVAIFSALTKLRQLALDPALVDPAHDAVGSAKLDLLVDHLEEITAEGHRALVFSQFTSFLSRVRDRLAAEDIGATYLDGSTRDRAAVIDEFRAGGAPVFLISLKAGGVGLTLTEADYVFVLDPWWNPAAEAQAVDRAHRIGQTAHVHVYRLVASDTIEEKVMELKGRKAELFARVIDGQGAMAQGIDADDIRGLFE